MKIGFIGYGNMGSAIGEGLIKSGSNVLYNDLHEKQTSASNVDIRFLIDNCKYIILAVKPHQYEDILKKYNFNNNIVVSIAAGITSSFIGKYTSKYILTMPNTPALINMGITAIVKNDSISSEEINEIKSIFESVGEVVFVEENELSNMICLTGSSPAYFFNYIDKLSIGLEHLGIDKDGAQKYLAKVMKSCANMILSSGDNAEKLTENVCSPNGTTIQAVNTLNESLEGTCTRAIQNCFNRAEQMKMK